MILNIAIYAFREINHFYKSYESQTLLLRPLRARTRRREFGGCVAGERFVSPPPPPANWNRIGIDAKHNFCPS